MASTDSCLSPRPVRCRRPRNELYILPLLALFLAFASATITVGTSDKLSTPKSTSSWTEITELNNPNSADTGFRGPGLLRQVVKNRLGIFHFGKIDQLSALEGYKNKKANQKIDDKEEHPLRTSIWELDLKWSFLSQKSKILSQTHERRAKRKGGNVQLELDPEGYCRIFESTESTDRNYEGCYDSTVLAIGRWKKRPWGVTIVVRPLSSLELSLNTPNLDGSSEGTTTHNGGKASGHGATSRIDEENEFVFHANNFHWNGFGTNPKLAQGTILFQKQKKGKNSCWWKSTTLANSSMLPIWPEELLSYEDGSDKLVGGKTASNLLSLSGILRMANQKSKSLAERPKWFRPVVGTFTAKGIMTRKND